MTASSWVVIVIIIIIVLVVIGVVIFFLLKQRRVRQATREARQKDIIAQAKREALRNVIIAHQEGLETAAKLAEKDRKELRDIETRKLNRVTAYNWPHPWLTNTDLVQQTPCPWQ